jgi:hypothetical protein
VLERCCALWPTGERCEGFAVVDDPARAGYVCYEHAPPGPRQRAAIAATIRKAMAAPDRYLAAALAEETAPAWPRCSPVPRRACGACGSWAGPGPTSGRRT